MTRAVIAQIGYVGLNGNVALRGEIRVVTGLSSFLGGAGSVCDVHVSITSVKGWQGQDAKTPHFVENGLVKLIDRTQHDLSFSTMKDLNTCIFSETTCGAGKVLLFIFATNASILQSAFYSWVSIFISKGVSLHLSACSRV